jgi:hypothetical protein
MTETYKKINMNKASKIIEKNPVYSPKSSSEESSDESFKSLIKDE